MTWRHSSQGMYVNWRKDGKWSDSSIELTKRRCEQVII